MVRARKIEASPPAQKPADKNLQTETHLRKEQEFVRRLIASFPDIIAVLDKTGRYTFISPRVHEILGYTPEEFIGLRLEERPHPEDRGSLMEFFRQLVSGETKLGTIEYRTAHKQGGWRIIRANAGPLTDSDGQIIGVVASARDVTESRRVEQQLLQSEKLAAIGQMVSGVAHELNNPLTAILGVADLLRERTPEGPARRQLDLIHKQARKAAELVQGLLMFSRPSKPQSQDVHAAELIARAIELRRSELHARHIHVQVDVAPELPPIEANPNHLVQVFVNIISNAEQAIGSLRDYGQLFVRVAETEGGLEILFDDDGPGVQPELSSKIFDPFFTTHRSAGGSGLGLTIALVIIKEHGGSIEAQAAPCGGARFRIFLPVAKGAAVNKAAKLAHERLHERTILVVEDEEGIRELVKEGLHAQGALVQLTQTADEAWNELLAHDFDAVLCDFNLGAQCGSELFDRIKTQKSRVPPFIFMTGELLDAQRISQLQEKGASTLQKPFQMAALISIIQSVISNSAPRP